MGEIGAIMARLEQEGLNLEQLINNELEAAGFLSLSARSTSSLSDRIDVISGDQSELKCLLKSIEDQLRQVQEQENIPGNLLEDKTCTDNGQGTKQVIVIDDDDDVPKSDFSSLAESTPGSSYSKTASSELRTTGIDSTSVRSSKEDSTSVASKETTLMPASITKTSSSSLNSPPPVTTLPTPPGTTPISAQPRVTPQNDSQVLNLPKGTSLPQTKTVASPLNSPLTTPAEVTLVVPESVIAYRTLRSPSANGEDRGVMSMITVKSSKPVSQPQNLRGANAPTPPSVATVANDPVTKVGSPAGTKPPAEATMAPESDVKEPYSGPKFDEGTRIIGKRSDDLWYPGEITKVMADRYSLHKFRVKFDQGNRGLLRPNHIALETRAPKGVLNIGSRVVALRPRETGDESASWRQAKEGPYGKLDVLYAGIVAEKCCPETRNRFLIFFDDGFAQYLPLHKLHHVYHTGDKVWNEVAEHSQEFIQEYLEEFPNRPMVVLKVNQWVKTEWRGKWLKAKVLEVDCSLVKMLFQVDNRTEWIYRGSTRLEPLFKALIDGKISRKKSSKRPKKQPHAPDEPYVDFSLTIPAFGFSPYSKTDTRGAQESILQQNKPTSNDGQLSSSSQTGTSSTSSSSQREPSSMLTTHQSSSTLKTQSPVAPSSQATVQPPSTSSSKTQTSAFTSQTQTQTPHSLAVRTLRRLANKVNDGNSSPVSKPAVEKNATTPPQFSKSVGSQSSNTNSNLNQDSTAKPNFTDNYHSDDTITNHVSPVNHVSSVNHFDDRNASIIASTMRKRTSAGLNTVNKTHMLGIGPDVIVPTRHNGIIPAVGSSPKKKWEAPWKIHSNSQLLTEPAMKGKVNNSKHDAATLIQERLQAEKKLIRTLKTMPELQSLVPKLPVLGPHQCAKPCGKVETISKEEQSKHNVLAIPLLLNWKREIAKRYPKSKKEIYYRAPCNKRLKSIEDVAKYLLLTGTSNVAIDQFSFDPEISCSDVSVTSENIISPDISHGLESVAISVMNEHDDSQPPCIDYVHDRVLSDGVHINTDPGFLPCCDCTDNCQDKTKCSCAQLTISASAAVDGKVDNTVGYEYRRLMDTVPTGIYECNQNCACSSQCFNRVVQNGIQLRLQVFKTENRGWGLRTLDDIPIGTFICTYSGQIMNEDMANKEGRDFGDEYLAELDHIEVVEKIKEGYESSVSDMEDDNVILKTLETENSASDLSDNESVDGSFVSDSESDDSNSSHSSYSPRAKKSENSKRKPAESVKITEDGTTFSVTMADERCVMAISSGDSIVLKRIGGPAVEQQDTGSKVKLKEDPSNQIDLLKDPPPMPKPTVIDLTSDDEDNSLITCSLSKAESDQMIKSETLSKASEKSDGKSPENTNKLEDNVDLKKFTDFKLFDIQNTDGSNSTENCHYFKGNNVSSIDVKIDDVKSDDVKLNDDVKSDEIKLNDDVKIDNVKLNDDAKSSLESKVNDSSVVLSSNDIDDYESANKIFKQSNKTELDSALENLIHQNKTTEASEGSTGPSHVACSVSEVTKQEEMDTDPCLRDQSQKPGQENTNASSKTNSDKACDSDRQDNSRDSDQDSSNHGDNISLKYKNYKDNVDTQDNDKNPLESSKTCFQGNKIDEEVSSHHGDNNDTHKDKSSDNVEHKNDNLISIEDNDVKIDKQVNTKPSRDGDVTDSNHDDKESIKSNESEKELTLDNDNVGCVDFELRMEIDDSMDSFESKECDMQSSDLSGEPTSLTNTDPKRDDSVPPLMSADDLSKIAAQIHQPDEEPPKLIKMQTGSRLTADLHDTIAKLQSRGVGLNNTSHDIQEEDSAHSFDDLPLFPSASSCDSFPASPASSQSGSWASDSADRSSEASFEQNPRRDRLKNDGRRARRFIVTLQKTGGKRCASPVGIEGGPYKRPTTRSLFNGEEHCYVIDAKAYGNCGRFLNHSCSPNLFVQNVFIDTHDLRFPRVAFFAQHNIRAGCELTWDYMYEVGSVQDKFLRCYCGSSQCRGRLL